jgi:hypothetical protein
MTVTDHNARFNGRRLGSNPDQDNQSRKHRNRRRRLHGDAELAMVGVVAHGVHVRHLGYSQQRQQGKTQHGDRRQSTQL